MQHALGAMTVQEVQQYLEVNQTIILPYGCVEQHGYHLPLDTDIHGAEILAFGLAEKLGCVVAPTLNYSFSGGMLPGTVNVKPNNFANMVSDIVESLTLQGFRNILILPGHLGSECLLHLRESLRILKWTNPALRDVLLMVLNFIDFSEDAKTGMIEHRDYHAGRSETSMLMAFRPDTVRMDKMRMDAPDVSERLRDDPDAYQERTALSHSPAEIVTTRQQDDVAIGVMGCPEKSSADFGREYIAGAVDAMAPAVKHAIEEAEVARRTGKRVAIADNEKLKILGA